MTSYDVIIVGGGSSGATLAGRLSEDPGRRVLLLEAGADYASVAQFPEALRGNSGAGMLPGSPSAWPLVGRLTSEVTGPVARARVIGGGSTVNGTYFIRGLPADFNRWAELGNTEWSYEKVLPFFRKLEHDLDYGDEFHGDDGPISVERTPLDQMADVSRRFVDACRELGYPNDPDKNARLAGDGVGPVPSNLIGGVRVNTAMAYLTPARSRPNLTVVGNAFVRRIIFDRQRAIGVEVESANLPERMFGGEIILASGAVKSPHLLLLSGIGPAADLGRLGIPVIHDAGGVGRFADHIEVMIPYRAPRRRKASGSHRPIEVALHYTADGSPAAASDMEILCLSMSMRDVMLGRAAGSSTLGGLLPVLRSAAAAVKALRGVSAGALARSSQAMSNKALILGVMDERGRGCLRARTDDPHDSPDLEFNFFTEADDRRRMRECIHRAIDLVNTRAFRTEAEKVLGPSKDELASERLLDQWMVRNPVPPAHLMSSCRMGPTADPDAVIDQQCRVHGVDGLRVVDLSICPGPLSRGPAATAIMIGERAAALMTDQTR